jgi:hypothetical protein
LYHKRNLGASVCSKRRLKWFKRENWGFEITAWLDASPLQFEKIRT